MSKINKSLQTLKIMSNFVHSITAADGQELPRSSMLVPFCRLWHTGSFLYAKFVATAGTCGYHNDNPGATNDDKAGNDSFWFSVNSTRLLFSYAKLTNRGLFLLTWINFNASVYKYNYIHYKMWVEIAYPFPNFNGCTVEVWEWISNFIPHFTMYVITYTCWD